MATPAAAKRFLVVNVAVDGPEEQLTLLLWKRCQSARWSCSPPQSGDCGEPADADAVVAEASLSLLSCTRGLSPCFVFFMLSKIHSAMSGT